MRNSLLLIIAWFLLVSFQAYSQKVTGKVTSTRDGLPLPGVSILIKGTTAGVATDVDGNYSLDVPNPQNDVLVFSYIGFNSEEIKIDNRTVIDIGLVEDLQQISEVVVTSLGIKREQKALGYAVSSITPEQLTAAGSTNLGSALYGKAPGVKITTAPGGASSAVNVQIRGINSLSYNQQPLYVVDGIIIRNDNQNGDKGANNNNYWDDQRIRGNGILDINPADIESMSILKGASATALYGSDAGSGVVVITTKRGSKKRGLGVDLNYTLTSERVAFLPKLQNKYGPGYDRATNVANFGASPEGWIPDSESPNGRRPIYRAWAHFGPEFTGEDVRWWDGSIRSFSSRPDNYRDVFDNGYSSNLNLSLSNQTETINYRLSATRMDYKGTSPGSTQERNTFNLNTNVKLSKKVNADIIVNYMNTKTHNRAYLLGQVLGSYDGFIARSEDVGLMRERYQTDNGYKYSLINTGRPDDFVYTMRGANMLDFFWNQLRNSYDETENRLISSATLNWDVVNHVKLRGRIGNDYTGAGIEDKRYNEYASVFNSSSNSSGTYSTSKGLYSILYGDVLATYANKIGENIDFSVSAGFQTRSEDYKDQNSSTNNGLVSENWFSLSNSYGIPTTTSTRKQMLKYAYLGLANISYKNFLFLEGTARQEYTSTLPPDNNRYFYPSVNASFAFTEAFQLPKFISFGKIRASYAVVGNGSPMYVSNVAFTQTSLQTNNGSVPSLNLKGDFGNERLRPEMKYEKEVGLDVRFLQNRLGVDFSYYSNNIKDQILSLSTAPSNGASKQLVNVGEVQNNGLELGLSATPIQTADFRWETRLNYSFNKSKLLSLKDGVPEVVFYDGEQSSIKIVAAPGEQLGNIYTYERAKDDNGNFIINGDGLYVIDKSHYVNAGSILPKAIGGFSNTVSYKNFSLDFTIDYRFGGKMVSPPTKYMTGAGLLENTLEFRDAGSGGLTYTENGVTYNDGVLLEGVVYDDETKTYSENTKIISAADYYIGMFYWGGDAWNEKGSIFDNSYVKLREAVISYRIPDKITEKINVQNVRISLIGRNLFYLYKTLENLDPEAPVGNRWWSQGVDLGSSAPTRSLGFSLNANF